MNTVFLTGRLTKKPELTELSNGTMFCSFRIACGRPYRDRHTGQFGTDFFTCQAWNKTAEYIYNIGEKGLTVLIQGSLKQSSWDRNGEMRSRVEVVVDRIEFVSRPKKSDVPPPVIAREDPSADVPAREGEADCERYPEPPTEEYPEAEMLS